jgi:hypothetical protein
MMKPAIQAKIAHSRSAGCNSITNCSNSSAPPPYLDFVVFAHILESTKNPHAD